VRFSFRTRGFRLPANSERPAAWVGGALTAVALASACAMPIRDSSPHVVVAPAPSPHESYCAWYGDVRDGLLYFGQAAFWSGMRATGGGPLSDLDREGPVPIGRFQLHRERLLEPMQVGRTGDRSGVWDVYAHPNGRIYFTTFFESAGWVDPRTGEVQRWPDLGTGLNEISPGPDGTLLFSRYAASQGSLVVVDLEGRLVAEHVLASPPGFDTQPKTVAFDPERGEFWATTDMLPVGARAEATEAGPGGARNHAYVLDRSGRELRRVEDREIQFVAFAEEGTGYFAELRGHALRLRVLAPADPEGGGREFLLSPDFPAAFDFVQDIRVEADGRAVVTRWSGWVHVLESDGRVRSVLLPELAPRGLYYTATLARGGQRVCATHCGEVRVVCTDLP